MENHDIASEFARVDEAVERLIKEIGFEYVPSGAPKRVYQVYLSHEPMLGGYQIRQVMGYGDSRPLFSEKRYGAEEMIDTCMFTLTGVAHAKRRMVDRVSRVLNTLASRT